MTMKTDKTPFRVRCGPHFDHVRGRDAAYQRLANYLSTTPEWIKENRRRHAGLIKRVSAADAKAAGI